jgi:hypothetical protein
VELLLHEKSGGGKHANAAVHQLGLTQAVHLEDVSVLSEAEGVERADGRERTWKACEGLEVAMGRERKVACARSSAREHVGDHSRARPARANSSTHWRARGRTVGKVRAAEWLWGLCYRHFDRLAASRDMHAGKGERRGDGEC